MTTLIRSSILTLILGAVLLVGEAFSVVVAPTAIYIDHRTRTAELTLYNPASQPEEVEIEAFFGYPATDDEGRLHLHVGEEGSDARSAAGWIRAFPRRLVLAPGARQTVRLLAEPPPELADGEYWARIAVTSRPQSIPAARGSSVGEVEVGLSVAVRTVISASYRKGEISTGVRIEDFAPHIEDGQLVLRPRLVREGNGAYIGELTVRLVDGSGSTVGGWSEQVAVYRDYHRRLAYDLGDLPSGAYRVELRLTTERPDIPSRHRLRSAPVEASAPIALP